LAPCVPRPLLSHSEPPFDQAFYTTVGCSIVECLEGREATVEDCFYSVQPRGYASDEDLWARADLPDPGPCARVFWFDPTLTAWLLQQAEGYLFKAWVVRVQREETFSGRLPGYVCAGRLFKLWRVCYHELLDRHADSVLWNDRVFFHLDSPTAPEPTSRESLLGRYACYVQALVRGNMFDQRLTERVAALEDACSILGLPTNEVHHRGNPIPVLTLCWPRFKPPISSVAKELWQQTHELALAFRSRGLSVAGVPTSTPTQGPAFNSPETYRIQIRDKYVQTAELLTRECSQQTGATAPSTRAVGIQTDSGQVSATLDLIPRHPPIPPLSPTLVQIQELQVKTPPRPPPRSRAPSGLEMQSRDTTPPTRARLPPKGPPSSPNPRRGGGQAPAQPSQVPSQLPEQILHPRELLRPPGPAEASSSTERVVAKGPPVSELPPPFQPSCLDQQLIVLGSPPLTETDSRVIDRLNVEWIRYSEHVLIPRWHADQPDLYARRVLRECMVFATRCWEDLRGVDRDRITNFARATSRLVHHYADLKVLELEDRVRVTGHHSHPPWLRPFLLPLPRVYSTNPGRHPQDQQDPLWTQEQREQWSALVTNWRPPPPQVADPLLSDAAESGPQSQ